MIDFLKNKAVHHREKAKENTKAFNEILFICPMTPSTTLLALPHHIHTSTVLQPCSCQDVLSILRLWCPIGPTHWSCKACTCFLFVSDSNLLSSANRDEPIQPDVLFARTGSTFLFMLQQQPRQQSGQVQLHHETVLNRVLLFLFPLSCKHLFASAMRAASLWHYSLCALFTAAVGLFWRVPSAGALLCSILFSSRTLI